MIPYSEKFLGGGGGGGNGELDAKSEWEMFG